jgi:hypothetical protein
MVIISPGVMNEEFPAWLRAGDERGRRRSQPSSWYRNGGEREEKKEGFPLHLVSSERRMRGKGSPLLLVSKWRVRTGFLSFWIQLGDEQGRRRIRPPPGVKTVMNEM